MARDPRLYALRFAPFALAAAAIVWHSLFGQTGIPRDDLAAIGHLLGVLSLAYGAAIAFFIAPYLAGAALAEEREAQTFELLLLADMRGLGVYLSKLVVVVVQTQLLLLGVLPFAAVSNLVGGMPTETLLRLLGLLSAVCAFNTILGLWVGASTAQRRAGAALAVGAALLLAAAEAILYVSARLAGWPLPPVAAVLGIHAAAAPVFAGATLRAMRLEGARRGPSKNAKQGRRRPWGSGRSELAWRVLAANAKQQNRFLGLAFIPAAVLAAYPVFGLPISMGLFAAGCVRHQMLWRRQPAVDEVILTGGRETELAGQLRSMLSGMRVAYFFPFLWGDAITAAFCASLMEANNHVPASMLSVVLIGFIAAAFAAKAVMRSGLAIALASCASFGAGKRPTLSAAVRTAGVDCMAWAPAVLACAAASWYGQLDILPYLALYHLVHLLALAAIEESYQRSARRALMASLEGRAPGAPAATRS